MVRSTDRPAMTIAVDLGRKATKQTNKLSGPSAGLVITEYSDNLFELITKIKFSISC